MAQHVYRDRAVASGPAFIGELLAALDARGWEGVAWSDGTTRSTDFSSLTNAAAFAAALGANDAWALMAHTASGRKLAFKRGGDANTWTIEYTVAGVSLSAGTGTAPDSHADTRVVFSNAQLYPTNAPTSCKAHIVVDDSKAGFVAFLRRTPFPGGDACGWVFMEAWSENLSWAADPDPCVVGVGFADNNLSSGSLFTAALSGWYRRGLSSPDYSPSFSVENCFTAAGSGLVIPGNVDTEFQVRVGRTGGGGGYPLGLSTLVKALNPYREPTTGLDAGATLNRAAFGGITTANDGTALGS